VRKLEGAGERGDVLVRAFPRANLDIGDPEAVSRIFDELPGGPPDVLVNAAAYNQVDLSESDGRAEADRINGEGPRLLAEASYAAGVRLVHVSTDYVLEGVGPTPLSEDSPPSPRTAYGRSKLRGEEQVRKTSVEAMIVRTSWVFGPGRNFVGAMLRQARLRREEEVEGPLRVVDDQRGCPTYAADLAGGILDLADAASVGSGDGGVYHLCNAPDPADDDAPTWWDFARAILDARGFEDIPIDRATTADFAAPAPRPAFSVLGCDRAAGRGVRLRSWREALAAYLDSPDLEVTRRLNDPDSDRSPDGRRDDAR
jgi:dTDP-4-dehydrorhamnose reductase